MTAVNTQQCIVPEVDWDLRMCLGFWGVGLPGWCTLQQAYAEFDSAERNEATEV